jgi:hypothetical protein
MEYLLLKFFSKIWLYFLSIDAYLYIRESLNSSKEDINH